MKIQDILIILTVFLIAFFQISMTTYFIGSYELYYFLGLKVIEDLVLLPLVSYIVIRYFNHMKRWDKGETILLALGLIPMITTTLCLYIAQKHYTPIEYNKYIINILTVTLFILLTKYSSLSIMLKIAKRWM